MPDPIRAWKWNPAARGEGLHKEPNLRGLVSAKGK